ncbi:MAG: hypothetical protein V4509_01805 [Patescibacteria group bacterium]
MQRFKMDSFSFDTSRNEAFVKDAKLEERIIALLPGDNFEMVDAFYYDFSVLPECVQNKFHGDMYLLFGIFKGEIVTRWVERYELDGGPK